MQRKLLAYEKNMVVLILKKVPIPVILVTLSMMITMTLLSMKVKINLYTDSALSGDCDKLRMQYKTNRKCYIILEFKNGYK